MIAVHSNDSLCTTVKVEIIRNYKNKIFDQSFIRKGRQSELRSSSMPLPKILVKLVMYFYGALKIGCQNQFSVYLIRKYYQF